MLIAAPPGRLLMFAVVYLPDLSLVGHDRPIDALRVLLVLRAGRVVGVFAVSGPSVRTSTPGRRCSSRSSRWPCCSRSGCSSRSGAVGRRLDDWRRRRQRSQQRGPHGRRRRRCSAPARRDDAGAAHGARAAQRAAAAPAAGRGAGHLPPQRHRRQPRRARRRPDRRRRAARRASAATTTTSARCCSPATTSRTRWAATTRTTRWTRRRARAIIAEHVAAGVELARRHGLPPLVQAFIPEHHGTRLIAVLLPQGQPAQDPNVDAERLPLSRARARRRARPRSSCWPTRRRRWCAPAHDRSPERIDAIVEEVHRRAPRRGRAGRVRPDAARAAHDRRVVQADAARRLPPAHRLPRADGAGAARAASAASARGRRRRARAARRRPARRRRPTRCVRAHDGA